MKLEVDPSVMQCCAKPAIAVMDYQNYTPDQPPSPRVHRVCTRCFMHWFGKPHRIRKYRRAAWNALIQADYEIDRVACQFANQLSPTARHGK